MMLNCITVLMFIMSWICLVSIHSSYFLNYFRVPVPKTTRCYAPAHDGDTRLDHWSREFIGLVNGPIYIILLTRASSSEQTNYAGSSS